MIDCESYLNELTTALQCTFGENLLYIGLQGSYLRGEADENSDFDVMLVFNELTPEVLDKYRGILIYLGHYEKSCGFVCSRDELANWNPMEICHVLHATRDVYGKLAELMPDYSREDVRNFVKLSANNLYHELCHRYIHRSRERNIAALPGTYQAVFFILQNLHWLRTGDFVQTKREMLDVTGGTDSEVLLTAMRLKTADEYDFDAAYRQLLRWCQTTIKTI